MGVCVCGGVAGCLCVGVGVCVCVGGGGLCIINMYSG